MRLPIGEEIRFHPKPHFTWFCPGCFLQNALKTSLLQNPKCMFHYINVAFPKGISTTSKRQWSLKQGGENCYSFCVSWCTLWKCGDMGEIGIVKFCRWEWKFLSKLILWAKAVWNFIWCHRKDHKVLRRGFTLWIKLRVERVCLILGGFKCDHPHVYFTLQVKSLKWTYGWL